MATTDDLRYLLEELYGHAVGLRQRWTLFQDLYGARKQVELMQATAPASFGLLQSALWESIVLAIARFLDRRTAAGRETVCLQRLIQAVPVEHDELRRSLAHRLVDLRSASDNIIRHRHDRFAQASLAVARMDSSLEGVTFRSVDHATNEIETMLLKVADRFFPADTWAFQGERDADTLMFFLQKGLGQLPPLRH
jgi:hypothetical protein